METKSNKRLETLEGEFKLIKGELKETLTSVRDYLMGIKLPLAEQAAIREDMGEEPVLMKGQLVLGQDTKIPEPPPLRSAELTPEEVISQPVEEDELFVPQSELPEQQTEYGELEEVRNEGLLGRGSGEKIRVEASQSAPQVNLLANLIRWVSNAKREIGCEQLTTFLEVYGISGHLSPELKEVILHLVDITEQQSADANIAEIWSQLILQLHGILAGGDTPLHPLKPFWDDGAIETQLGEIEIEGDETEGDKTEDKPLKLKLVVPSGDGGSKEFTINLNPEVGKESP